MEIISTQKYILMSPKKIRPVAKMAQKMKPKDAVERLPFLGKKATVHLVKVIRTALANAKDRGLSDDVLRIKEIQVTEGPRLKRGRPVSRGQWHPIIKKMSHIRVVLESFEEKTGAEEKQEEAGKEKTGKKEMAKKVGKGKVGKEKEGRKK